MNETRSISLAQLHIAEPCHEDWEAMSGDDAQRFCAGCQKHVHNLDALSQGEIDGLFESRQGRLCVRYTVPERAQAAMKPTARGALIKKVSRVAAGILLASWMGLSGCSRATPTSGPPTTLVDQFNDWRWRNVSWLDGVLDPLFGSPVVLGGRPMVMGMMVPATMGGLAPAPTGGAGAGGPPTTAPCGVEGDVEGEGKEGVQAMGGI